MQFILQKTGGDASAPSYNADPFTGGGAYVPGMPNPYTPAPSAAASTSRPGVCWIIVKRLCSF